MVKIDNYQKLQNLTGISKKANNIYFGESLIKMIREERVFFVIIKKSASANFFKMISQKCFHYNIPLYSVDENIDLDKATGMFNVNALGFKKINYQKKY